MSENETAFSEYVTVTKDGIVYVSLRDAFNRETFATIFHK